MCFSPRYVYIVDNAKLFMKEPVFSRLSELLGVLTVELIKCIFFSECNPYTGIVYILPYNFWTSVSLSINKIR